VNQVEHIKTSGMSRAKDAMLAKVLEGEFFKLVDQTFNEETLIRLSEAQARQVFSLLENPPKANARLKCAAELFKANVRV